MSKKYQIWNGQDLVVTPSDEVFTPEQWLARYPAYALIPSMVMVLGSNPYNGSLIDELYTMKSRAEAEGAVFDEGLTNQELLDAIEAWEEEKAIADAEAARLAQEEEQAMAMETLATQQTIAASLEYQNMMNY